MRIGSSVSSEFSGIAETVLNYDTINIFVTASTGERRDYLHESVGIAQDHNCNSRNLSFAQDIRQRADGQGVNVILNSLTGGLLDESWGC